MPDPLINRRLGKYLIQQEIGRGGMARVYRATDTVLQRTVALKILAPQIGNDPELARRFDREAITAANLRHPSIITIFDVGEAEGLRYIAMEYVAGRTLAEVLADHGKLNLPLTISVLQPVAEALQYAHSQGAVHRDVKPQNVMIDTDGRVLLTDFGIAVGPAQQSQKLTQAGLFMGTPEYISPEQAQGQGLNGLSDLYSLGIVAYELLAGSVPFSGGIPQLIMAHVYTAPQPITSINPQLPPELDRVFARVLAKAPDQRLEKTTNFVEALRLVAQRHGLRPATPAEVAALAVPSGSSAGQSTVRMSTPPPAQTALDAEQIAAVFGPPTVGSAAAVTPPSNAPPAPRPPQRTTPPALVYPQAEEVDFAPPRRPRPAAAGPTIPWPGIIVVLLAVLLAAVVISRSSSSAGTDPTAAQATPHHTLFSPATPSATATSTTVIPVVASNPTQVPTTVPSLTPATKQPSSALQVTSAGLPAPTPTPTAPAAGLSPTAVLATMAAVATMTALPSTATPGPTVTIAPPTNTSVPPTATPPSPTATELPPSPTMIPASPTLLAPTATLPPSAPTSIGAAGHLVTQAGNALLLFDVTANKTLTIAADANSIGPAAISPDGQTVLFDATRGGKRSIFRYDTTTGKTQPLLKPDGAEMYHPAWAPNGSRIVFVSTASGNPSVYALDTAGNVQRLTNDSASNDYPSFSPDGTQIIFESNRDGGKYALFLLDAAGLHRFSPPGQPFDDRYPRFSPDGTALVFTSTRDRVDGGTEIYVQPFVGGSPRRVTTFAGGSASGPAWSPDGKLIAFFGNATGKNDIYMLPVGGGTPTDLSATSAADARWPVWGK